MPIRAERRSLYPTDWPAIRARILARAQNRCEQCGVYNRDWGYREPDGTFRPVKRGPLLEAGYRRPPFEIYTQEGRTLKIIEIVLTIAHLNHDESDCRDENLKALCQLHHLRYDADHHRQTRRAALEERGGQGRLNL